MNVVLGLVFLVCFGEICDSHPCPDQFLPVAVHLETESAIPRISTNFKKEAPKNASKGDKEHHPGHGKEVLFVAPTDPAFNKTHEENLILPEKDEANNLLIPSNEERPKINLTDLILPEELPKIKNTSKHLQDFIANVLSGFIRRQNKIEEENILNNDATTPAIPNYQHIMKIPNENDKQNDIIPDLSETTTSVSTERTKIGEAMQERTKEEPNKILPLKPQKNRKRKIKTNRGNENLVHPQNLIWRLKTINEKPAEEVLATDKASSARNLKHDSTESAVIKVKNIKS